MPPAPERILIIRPSALGDVCRTVPVLASLRASYPASRIDWVVRDAFVAAVAAHPALTEVIPFPRARFARWWRQPRVAGELWTWLRDIGRRRYDLVLDCQGLGRSGLIAWATRAPVRIGPSDAREFAWIGYTRRVPVARHAHTVDRMLALAGAGGAAPRDDMQLHVADADRAWWTTSAAARDLDGPYAVLAPTARWASKRWPIERWVALVPELAARGIAHVVVIGAPGEQEQAQALTEQPGVVNLVGETTVGQTMAVIADADLVIANDSAPLHMAVGFDRPLVALFGPTDPVAVGPYRRDAWVVRPEDGVGAAHYRASSTGDRHMRAIPIEAVVERLDAALVAARGAEVTS